MNGNLHVYCPKCGSEVVLTDNNSKAIIPKAGDFFLRLKDNDPEKAKKIKDVISAMMGDDVEFSDISAAKETSKAHSSVDPMEAMFGSAPNNCEDDEEDEIEQSIMEDGDINSKFMWRRWILSQVLRHYKTKDGEENFHEHFVKNTPLKYAFKVAANEMEALSKNMSQMDRDEREQFFNLSVTRQMVKDYAIELDKKINQELVALDKHNRVLVSKKGFDVKLKDDVHIGRHHYTKEKAQELRATVADYAKAASRLDNYKDMADLLREITKRLPMFNDCPKSKAWINAFKGAGAFYTLDNLIRWHKCSITSENGETYTGDEALAWLRRRTKELSEGMQYYKLYAIMKRTVEENNFDFNKRMKELRESA